MTTDDKIEKIMNVIAIKEERKMFHTLRYVMPMLIVLSAIMFAYVHRMVIHLIESEVFRVIADVEFDEMKIFDYLAKISSLFWAELEKEALFASVLSVTGIVFVFTRARLSSIPHRIHEIRKYKRGGL